MHAQLLSQASRVFRLVSCRSGRSARLKGTFMRSRRIATSTGLVLGLLALGASRAAAQPEVQGVGTWKLNVAKSKLGPGPAPRSLVSTIEAVDGGTRMTGVRVGADGGANRGEVHRAGRRQGLSHQGVRSTLIPSRSAGSMPGRSSGSTSEAARSWRPRPPSFPPMARPRPPPARGDALGARSSIISR